jgi:hypothetical protein
VRAISAHISAHISARSRRIISRRYLTDEGFISFYMDAPLSVFPRVKPDGVGLSAPEAMVRKVELRNFAKDQDEKYQRQRVARGNRAEYTSKVRQDEYEKSPR